MPIRINYKGAVIECDSEEELRAVLSVLGDGKGDASPIEPKREKGSGASTQTPAGRDPRDHALLLQFVQGGNAGVEAGKVGNMLGTQKRGIEPAIRKWAERVGLASNGMSSTVAEQCRIGTKRAWRLTSGMLDVGRHILGQT